MKFYIFASDTTDKINCNIASYIKSSENYYEIREHFDHINGEYRYAHSYLVADFGTKPKTSILEKNVASLNTADIANLDYVPFLLIGEFHYNGFNDCTTLTDNGDVDLGLTIRHDAMSIKLDGFTQRFANNEYAILCFMNNVAARIPATMYITFETTIFKNGELLSVVMEKKVADTVEVIRNGDRTFISKIQLGPDPYKQIAFEPRKLYNYDLDTNYMSMVV